MSKINRKKLLNPLFATDSYKHSHHGFVPDGTSLLYSHLTPRGNKRFLNNYPDHDDKIVVYGIRYLIEKLQYRWKKGFFDRKWKKIEKESLQVLGHHLGFTETDLVKFKKLHELGYLPLQIKAIKEGSLVDSGVPILTVVNTLPEYFWLTNFIESYILNTLCPAMTAATITREFAKLRDEYFDLTVEDQSFKGFHLHNFSYRGCHGHEVAGLIGSAHNLFTLGTDTLYGIAIAQEYYGAGEVAYSVNAGEHSVVTLGINYYDNEDKLNGEYLNLRSLLTEKYPNGILSYIADSYDFWRVIDTILPNLKEEIMARQGKLVIRPDTGDAVINLCGYRVIETPEIYSIDKAIEYALLNSAEVVKTDGKFYLIEPQINAPTTYKEISEAEALGLVETLWNIFGGTTNDKGYRQLDSHIGIIYGDGLSYHKVKRIYELLSAKGFAVDNVILAQGAYTMSTLNDRDQFNVAIKASAAIVNGDIVPVFKDPATDHGKKSVKGFLKVTKDEQGKFTVHEDVTEEEELTGELEVVLYDGTIYNSNVTYEQIKEIANS